MKRRIMSQGETIQANDLMKVHLVPCEGTDMFEYINGYSDAKVAQEVSPTLRDAHAKNLRMALYGRLRPAKTDDLESLRDQLKRAVDQLTELTVKHNKLCDSLSVNKVLDVRHLNIFQLERTAAKI